MKKVCLLFLIVSLTLSSFAKNTLPNDVVNSSNVSCDKSFNAEFAGYPKDSCIRIYSYNSNGYNHLVCQRTCAFDAEISVEVRCKCEITNIKTGHTGVYTRTCSLDHDERQWVIESLPDTLYEYGKILDCDVEPQFFSGCFEAYSISGKRLYEYDIEVHCNREAKQYYARYLGSLENRVQRECLINLSSPYECSFSLEVINRGSLKNVTVQAKLTRGEYISEIILTGTINTDREVVYIRDTRGRIVKFLEYENSDNSIIIYKGTQRYGTGCLPY